MYTAVVKLNMGVIDLKHNHQTTITMYAIV